MKPSETVQLAKKIARSKKARVYALVGELGAGKTTFVQAFLRELGVKGPITSPTFLIFRKYELGDKNIYHVDAYRVNKVSELTKLGFENILKDKDNIILIEWADKIKKLIPKDAQWIYFEHGKTAKDRKIVLK